MVLPSAMQETLRPYRRIVIKIGSALLVDRTRGELHRTWVESLADDVRLLRERGTEVLLVSSGSIALGRGVLGFARGPLALEQSQAAAAVGQIALARTYAEILGARGITAGQILLTLGDTEQRRRYLNARATVKTLLAAGAVPVINENDTVATSEIKYGDNDRLAARVAAMMSADLLVLLSDIDGLYTAPPNLDPGAVHIPVVERITPEIEAMAGAAGSELSRGGMKTKIEAGKMATAAGCSMVIASGKVLHPLRTVDRGGLCTWFRAHETPVSAWKAWIVGSIEPRGQITVDKGAARALKSGKSLLPAGIVRVDGQFRRGDAVSVLDDDGLEIARGLIAYDSDDAARIMGHNSGEIAEILGYDGRTEMIHRDELALV